MFQEFQIKPKDNNKGDFDKSHEILKEMTSVDKIDIKTELNDDEIKFITKIKFFENYFNNKGLQNLTSSFMRLRLSKDRNSRKEILEAFKAGQQIDEKNIRLGMINNDALNPNNRLK